MPEDEADYVDSAARPLTAFNARTMSVRQVVASFVVPEAFDRLRRPVNTLLSGPRGSGKTTLMKMLQPMALELWEAKEAPLVSAEIPYTGVFIPTDRTWKRQLEPHITKTNPFGPELKLVANAAFSVHVMRELLLAMQFRLSPPSMNIVRRPRVAISDDGLTRLSFNLARLLRVEQFEPSLEGLVDALSIRMSDLQSLRNALRDGRHFPIPNWTQLDCLSAAEAAIEMFNRAAGDREHQWALLFDEMELAPTAIVTSLLDAMRGQPQNLLLKLSLSPVQPELAVLHLPHSAVHGQDFELIQLNYSRQKEALKFGTDMLTAQFQRRGVHFESAASLLGRSLFSSVDEGAGGRDYDELAGRRRSPYSRNSSLWKRYSALAAADATFAEWLTRSGIDLDGLDSLDAITRASKLRKVRNLVVVRQYYRSAESRRRSRKTYELYAGADTIVAFCDGNARLLTALIGQLIAQAKAHPTRAISGAAQSQAIDSIIKRFFALVYAAEAVVPPSGNTATLADLVTRIGEALAGGVVEAPFTDNVPLAFTVDKAVTPATIRLLHAGINVGAFVHIPKRPDYRVPLDLVGEHFRLTYVLAPYFGLPVRLGPATSLTNLLTRAARKDRRARAPRHTQRSASTGQIVLFSDGDRGRVGGR